MVRHLGIWRIDELLPARHGQLNAQQPDIIMMISTNDMIVISMLVMHLHGSSALIDQITNLLPNANLLVYSIPPIRGMKPSSGGV